MRNCSTVHIASSAVIPDVNDFYTGWPILFSKCGHFSQRDLIVWSSLKFSEKKQLFVICVLPKSIDQLHSVWNMLMIVMTAL